MKLIQGLKSVTRRKKVLPSAIIQDELDKAYAIHPAHLMSGSVISALADAGFRIISEDELADEVACAFQAGVASVTDAEA